MFRFVLIAGGLLAATGLAQNPPPKPKPLDLDALGTAVAAAGLKSEVGQGVYKVHLPGDDGWFVEVWPSKTAAVVLVTFPCQGLPGDKPDPAPLLKLLAQNGRMDGAYFGYNDKTKNFYLESTLAADGLSGPKLRAELDRLQKLAVKTADLWDTGKWAGGEKK